MEQDKSYVLAERDQFGIDQYYIRSPNSWFKLTLHPRKATILSFNDAMETARNLRGFGGHFRVVLLKSILES